MKFVLFTLLAVLSFTFTNAQKMEKTGSKKVVILLAHPNLQGSTANKALLEAVKDLPQVEIIDLYATPSDPRQHVAAIEKAKAVVFQFPFYWASAPSQLKKWLDEVFTPLAGTPAVQGKKLMVATTTGSEYDAYRSGGRNHFTMDELLRPYQLVANHSGMIWQTPVVVYGMGTPEASRHLKAGATEYRSRIEKL